MAKLRKWEDGTIELPEGSLFQSDGNVRLPDGKILWPNGTVQFPNDELLFPDGSPGVYDPYLPPSPIVLDATKGDRTSALLVLKSFADRYSDNKDEEAAFVAACLSDFLKSFEAAQGEKSRGAESPGVGEILKKAFKQQGRIDTVRQRKELIKDFTEGFLRDVSGKERNEKLRAILRANGLDEGMTNEGLNKAINNALSR